MILDTWCPPLFSESKETKSDTTDDDDDEQSDDDENHDLHGRDLEDRVVREESGSTVLSL